MLSLDSQGYKISVTVNLKQTVQIYDVLESSLWTVTLDKMLFFIKRVDIFRICPSKVTVLSTSFRKFFFCLVLCTEVNLQNFVMI